MLHLTKGTKTKAPEKKASLSLKDTQSGPPLCSIRVVCDRIHFHPLFSIGIVDSLQERRFATLSHHPARPWSRGDPGERERAASTEKTATAPTSCGRGPEANGIERL